jgi:hypothetical protein
MAVACTKPLDLGYPEELWATRTLALHARKHGPEAGHPCLAMLGRGTVSKLLTGAELRPHKIEYYLERREPEFDTKMVAPDLPPVQGKHPSNGRDYEYKRHGTLSLEFVFTPDPVVFRWRYKLEEESVS